MNTEQYNLLMNCFDNLLVWVLNNNHPGPTQKEFDEIKSKKLKEEFDRCGISVGFSNTPPTTKWIPIDSDNLPLGIVSVMDDTSIGKILHFGRIYYDNCVGKYFIMLSSGHTVRVYNPTYYILQSDLLNLPVSG
jgi:hypothetical protein